MILLVVKRSTKVSEKSDMASLYEVQTQKQRFFLVVWELLRNFAAEIRNSNNEYSDFCLRRRYQLREPD